jgi:hypothetical protein
LFGKVLRSVSKKQKMTSVLKKIRETKSENRATGASLHGLWRLAATTVVVIWWPLQDCKTDQWPPTTKQAAKLFFFFF